MRKRVSQWAVELGGRLREVRRKLGIKGQTMAHELGLSSNTYYRNESGLHAPGLLTVMDIGRRYSISLDWLLLNRGERDYREPVESGKGSPHSDEEVREMLEYMGRFPSLRHELLMHFYKYKEANPSSEK